MITLLESDSYSQIHSGNSNYGVVIYNILKSRSRMRSFILSHPMFALKRFNKQSRHLELLALTTICVILVSCKSSSDYSNCVPPFVDLDVPIRPITLLDGGGSITLIGHRIDEVESIFILTNATDSKSIFNGEVELRNPTINEVNLRVFEDFFKHVHVYSLTGRRIATQVVDVLQEEIRLRPHETRSIYFQVYLKRQLGLKPGRYLLRFSYDIRLKRLPREREELLYPWTDFFEVKIE